MKTDNNHYTKALRFNWLTKYYDKIVSLTTRERIFKRKLLATSNLLSGQNVLDVGSGTGTLAIWIKKKSFEHTRYRTRSLCENRNRSERKLV